MDLISRYQSVILLLNQSIHEPYIKIKQHFLNDSF